MEIPVNGVDGKDHHLACVDKRRPDVDHFKVFEVEKASVLTGNKENGASGVTIDLPLHVTV